jgi:hypothetical protein
LPKFRDGSALFDVNSALIRSVSVASGQQAMAATQAALRRPNRIVNVFFGTCNE